MPGKCKMLTNRRYPVTVSGPTQNNQRLEKLQLKMRLKKNLLGTVCKCCLFCQCLQVLDAFYKETPIAIDTIENSNEDSMRFAVDTWKTNVRNDLRNQAVNFGFFFLISHFAEQLQRGRSAVSRLF